MTLLQKIRTSFTTQLTLWVGGFVLVTSGVVFFLLGRYSQDVIHEQTIDTMQQFLENTALQIDNRLRQTEITARLEKQTLTVDREMIERLVAENDYLTKLKQSMPNATLEVTAQPESIASQNSDENQYVYYEAIGQRSYSLVATCPASDVYGRFSRMQSVLLSWGVVGVLGLLLILYYVVSLHLRPFHVLADAAQSMAEGNLNTPIPATRHEDETGRLQNSLKKMQRSLKDYMDEMQHKQATLSRQNAALQASYGEAQAYETMKTQFVRKMTAQMANPVDVVCQCTESICHDYAGMTKPELVRHQMNIMKASESITQLLDKLMNNSPDTPPTTVLPPNSADL